MGHSKFYKSVYTSAHIANTSVSQKSHSPEEEEILAKHRVDLGGEEGDGSNDEGGKRGEQDWQQVSIETTTVLPM